MAAINALWLSITAGRNERAAECPAADHTAFTHPVHRCNVAAWNLSDLSLFPMPVIYIWNKRKCKVSSGGKSLLPDGEQWSLLMTPSFGWTTTVLCLWHMHFHLWNNSTSKHTHFYVKLNTGGLKSYQNYFPCTFKLRTGVAFLGGGEVHLLWHICTTIPAWGVYFMGHCSHLGIMCCRACWGLAQASLASTTTNVFTPEKEFASKVDWAHTFHTLISSHTTLLLS